TMILWSSVRKYSSCPVRDQTGIIPPASEICTLVPLSGKARTYTSYVPASASEYATHRPSGENAAYVLTVDVLRNNLDSPNLSSRAVRPAGMIRIPAPVAGASCKKASNFPSGVKEFAKGNFSERINACVSPPYAGVQNKPPVAWKMTNCPSGVHT